MKKTGPGNHHSFFKNLLQRQVPRDRHGRQDRQQVQPHPEMDPERLEQ